MDIKIKIFWIVSILTGIILIYMLSNLIFKLKLRKKIGRKSILKMISIIIGGYLIFLFFTIFNVYNYYNLKNIVVVLDTSFERLVLILGIPPKFLTSFSTKALLSGIISNTIGYLNSNFFTTLLSSTSKI